MSYLSHQMSKESQPTAQVKRWVDGVLSQANDDIAASTLPVLWNAGGVGNGAASGRHFASTPLASLLHEPFTELGAAAPELSATLVAHAVLGRLSDHLWQASRPTPREVKQILEFCLRTASG